MTSTTIVSRVDAQRRTDEIRMFQAELHRLADDGALVLSDEQRRSVAEYHAQLLARFASQFDIDPDLQSKQLSLGMRIASFLGALALAASVFFLFYRFWGMFAETAQVTILAAAALGSFVVPFWIQTKDSSGYFTKLAALVAFACFVLDVTMLGQIFNITPSDLAFLPWAAVAFMLAYAFDLRLMLAAGIFCIVAFIAARTGTWGGMYWLDFGERPENFFLPAVILFFIPQLIRHDRFPGFAATYRVFGLLTLFIPILVLANWGDLSYMNVDRKVLQGSYQLAGFVGSGVAIWLGARRHWSEVVNTGVTLFVIFLYTKFFDWWWESMPKYLFFLVLGLTAVLLLLVFRRIRAGTHERSKGEAK